ERAAGVPGVALAIGLHRHVGPILQEEIEREQARPLDLRVRLYLPPKHDEEVDVGVGASVAAGVRAVEDDAGEAVTVHLGKPRLRLVDRGADVLREVRGQRRLHTGTYGTASPTGAASAYASAVARASSASAATSSGGSRATTFGPQLRTNARIASSS